VSSTTVLDTAKRRFKEREKPFQVHRSSPRQYTENVIALPCTNVSLSLLGQKKELNPMVSRVKGVGSKPLMPLQIPSSKYNLGTESDDEVDEVRHLRVLTKFSSNIFILQLHNFLIQALGAPDSEDTEREQLEEVST